MSDIFGAIIKEWRAIRRFSQMGLSLESGLSSRHISFLETGRAKPSRGSVLTLARVLDMPRPAVNKALLAAGLAPEYSALTPTDDDLAVAMGAMAMMLENHSPFPAITIDAGWNIVGGNPAAHHLMQFLPLNNSLSLIDALLNDDVTDPVIVNWHTVAHWTLLRLQVELSRTGQNKALSETYARLEADPRLKGASTKSFSDFGPVLTTQIRVEGIILSFLTMLAEFSTVTDVTMNELRIELFFAADEPTRDYFTQLSL